MSAGGAQTAFTEWLALRSNLYDEDGIYKAIGHKIRDDSGVTLADEVKLLGRIVPVLELDRCVKLEFVLLRFRRGAGKGGPGKIIERLFLASVAADATDAQIVSFLNVPVAPDA